MVILQEPIVVNPTTARATHHVSLVDEDGHTLGLIAVDGRGNANPEGITRSPIDRTALKTTSGNTTYNDQIQPWSPIVQENWAGGRGLLDFEKDTTRYYDGYQANTIFGEIYLGPQEKFSTGIRLTTNNAPGSVRWVSLIPGPQQRLAVLFTPDANVTAENIMLWLKRKGTPAADLTIKLSTTTGGHPDTDLATITITTTDIDDVISRKWRALFSGQALVNGTYYWIQTYSTTGDEDNHWLVGCLDAAGNTKESQDGATWTASLVDIYYRIMDAESDYQIKFFQYKGAQYAIQQQDTGAPKLFINGDRGAADSNSGDLTYLNDATKTWIPNEWNGCTVKVTEGPGMDEDTNYRPIGSNGDKALPVTPDWKVPHTTTTAYVILGSLKWTEIAGHGLTGPVTDILIVNGIVYFAQGDAIYMRRMREYNNAGTWTREFLPDGTNYAFKLTAVRDETNGLEIWRAQNVDATSIVSLSKAPVIAWAGTGGLVFGTVIPLVDDNGKICRITEYGDTTKQLWIIREGIWGNITTGGKYDELELKEIRALADSSNGRLVLRHNVYLYSNLGGRLERYYDRNLQDVGPNRDEGLPLDRQGILSCGVGLPGMIMIGIDGGLDNFSSIVINGAGDGGYCEIYRSPMKGDRIWDMQYQVIPGTQLDYVWVAVGKDIICIPWSIDRPRDNVNYFTNESVVISGYAYAGMKDIYKFVHAMKIFAEGMEPDVCWVEADYQVEEETAWTPLPDVFDGIADEVLMTNKIGVNGKRIRTRLRLQTSNNRRSPRINSVILDCISRSGIKYSFNFNYRVLDDDVNLQGDHDPMTAAEKQDLLDYWAMNLTPLKMNCIHRQYHDKTVFINPSPSTPQAEFTEKYVQALSVIQI
jgi:hypothetical protein